MTPLTILRWLVTTPAGVCLLLVASAVPAWLASAGALVTFVAMMVFSLASPVICALRPWWWSGTALSGLTLVAVVFAIGVSPSIHDMREGAMVFMLPLMVYPIAVGLSGIVRLVLWWRGRRRA